MLRNNTSELRPRYFGLLLSMTASGIMPASHMLAVENLISGGVAQLGERCVRNAEVRGSIPLISTI